MSTVEAVASHRASRERPPSVEIVVPVYNEEAELEASILRLRWFLDTSFPFDATVTVADNASTDRTWEIAAGLARRVPGVRAVRLAEKGRGRALRAAWMASDATVVAYMDVDLATGLDALLPLVAPLLSGHSDVAIGTRLARGSRVVRGPKRELISRGYNLIVRVALHNGFSDAQCGFKAVRTDVARALLPMVEDETWFFDTELLVLAERHALRIHEVPVDWTDDPDSRVDIRQTAVDDLRGVWRLMRARPARDVRAGRSTSVAPTSVASAPVVGGRPDPDGSPLARFAGVGLVSTVAFLVLYLALRAPLGDYGANAAALVVCTVANTVAHRRVTFAGADPSAGTAVLGATAVLLTSLAFTTAGLAVAGWLAPASLAVQLGALLVATGLAGLVRFVLLRAWVFRAHRRSATATPGPRRPATATRAR
ncbi:MAG TPA: bifunctional glycosyltransferase family 2/GtrA family protein [Acidimicrobiales bacterium]|nr:bifunctional glycosyltransferase family 2/GtrA family protein [Acidimicrobiales bacterium]